MRRRTALAAVAIVALAGCASGGPAPGSGSGGLPAGSALPGWTTTGSMGTPRHGHTATLLQDGRVLVAGGGSGGETDAPTSSAETWDPATGAWSPTGSMHSARSEHSATLLQDGRVLVVGGWQADAELYDPASGTWTPTGSPGAPRRGYTATLLPDGRVLVAGGTDPSSGIVLASTEIFDPATGQWTASAPMGAARAGHAAALLPDGRVLIAGGMTNQSGPTDPAIPTLASAELLDPATGQWRPAGDMGASGERLAAVLRADGGVVVIGGLGIEPTGQAADNVHVYDPATRSWHASGKVETWLGPTAFLLADGRVLLGGALGGRLEVYDVRTESSTMIASPHEVTSGHTLTLLADGSVLQAGGVLLGGNGGFGITSEYLASAHRYRP
jgi:Galactose oxidase, central domain